MQSASGADNAGEPANLWLCAAVSCSGNGHGYLEVYESARNVGADPQGVGAFEFGVQYDDHTFDITITPTSWLDSTGRIPDDGAGAGGCAATTISENDVRFGCVSKDPQPLDPANGSCLGPDNQTRVGGAMCGPAADGQIAMLRLTPKPELVDSLSPGDQNGAIRTLSGEGCALFDIWGHPLSSAPAPGGVDAQGGELPLPGVDSGGGVADCGHLAVTVRVLEGDTNLDCKVDVSDDQVEAAHYGSTLGSLLYSNWYDVEPAVKDGDVDVRDLQKVFGRTGSTCDHPIPPQPPSAPLVSSDPPVQRFWPAQTAVAASRYPVCSLLNPDGSQASIIGQDGGYTATVGGTTYWAFGDTALRHGLVPGQIPNSIATSTDHDAGDCISLSYKQTNGIATPLLPKDPNQPDEATVWPVSLVPADSSGSVVHFFFASVSIAQAPFVVRYIGLAKFDTSGPDALNGKRVIDSSFFDPSVTGVQAIVDGDYVYAFLSTGGAWHADVRLARVPRNEIEDVSAYTYWDTDTQSFVNDFASSSPLFGEDFGLLPGHVSWNAFLGKWTMVYNSSLAANVSMRTADALWGPWSDPTVIFDCREMYQRGTQLPTYCYAATEHPDLQKNGGQTIYITVANEKDYRLFVHEVQLASPVHEFAGTDGQTRYCADPCANPPQGTDLGVAFFASTQPGRVLSAIHQYTSSSGEVVYSASPPEGAGWTDDEVAFYARTSLPDVSLRQEPVYRWDASPGASPAHVYRQFAPSAGYTRARVAFYTSCPADNGDGFDVCRASIRKSDPVNVDTDGDGCPDGAEVALGLDPLNPWDFYSVPAPALFTAADPTTVVADSRIGWTTDFVALSNYVGRGWNDAVYRADYDDNGIADGLQYDRSRILTPGKPDRSGPPDGLITATGDGVAMSAQLGSTCPTP